MKSTYIIDNKKFYISEERYEYNKIRRLYQDYSNYLVDEFKLAYMNENKNLKDVYNNISKQGDDRIIQIAKITCEHLKEDNIININGEELFLNYKKTDRYNIWKEQVHRIKIKYLELEYGKKYVSELYGVREEKKVESMEESSSGQKVLREAVDKVENIIDKGISYFEKNSLHRDKRILKTLVDSLYETCFAMHYDYINIVEKNKGEKLYSYVDREDEREAEELFEKIFKKNINRSERLDMFFEILNKNPYEEKYYKYVFMEYGDKTGELERLARNFGVDINSYKVQSVLEHYNRYKIKTSSLVTLREELIQIIRLYLIKINLLNHSNSIKLDTNNFIIEEIDKMITEERNSFNIINGIEYESFEIAMNIKKERELLEKHLALVDLKSIEELKSLVSFINREIKTNIKDDYLYKLNKIIENLRGEEIEDLIDGYKKDTIEDIEKLIRYISKKYRKDESEKHIRRLNNKINYFKTREKISDTYEEVKDKSKDLFKRLFD